MNMIVDIKSATVDTEITLPKYSFSRVTLQTLLVCAIGINTQEDSSVDFLILVPNLMFYRLFLQFAFVVTGQRSDFENVFFDLTIIL